jgi:hypothetical protein
MNLFLKRLLYFITPLLFFLISLEVSVRKIPNSFQLKENYLQSNATEIETLILGSSHTLYGLNPRYFNSHAFNASNKSQSPDVDLAILKSYESLFINLKTLVIRLSYDTLFEQLKNSLEDWRLKDYKLYTSVNFDYKIKHSSEVLSTGTRQALKTLKNNYLDYVPLLHCDTLGWGNDLKLKTKPDLKVVGIKVAKKHTAENWDLLHGNIKNFNEILSWCRERGIEVLLLTPPGYRSYSDNLEEKQLSKMIEVGEQLSLRYNNCTYINFLRSKDFESYDFFDPDHLNEIGAKKFSLIVNSLIEN